MRQKCALIEPLQQPPADSTLWDKVVPTRYGHSPMRTNIWRYFCKAHPR